MTGASRWACPRCGGSLHVTARRRSVPSGGDDLWYASGRCACGARVDAVGRGPEECRADLEARISTGRYGHPEEPFAVVPERSAKGKKR